MSRHFEKLVCVWEGVLYHSTLLALLLFLHFIYFMFRDDSKQPASPSCFWSHESIFHI